MTKSLKFPLRFRLGYDRSTSGRQYQAEGMMGTKPVLYVPVPESELQPSEMGTLFLTSWGRTLEEYPMYNIVGVILHHELRPLEVIEEEMEKSPLGVRQRIKAILKPAPTTKTLRVNRRAQEKSHRACAKKGNKTTC